VSSDPLRRAQVSTRSWPGDEPPDMAPVRALAEAEEFADARSRLADASGDRLRNDHPLMPLAGELAKSLAEAGFTLHHCGRYNRLHRLGGVCLLPVSGDWHPAEQAGIAVSWTTHDLLSCDWQRWAEYRDVPDPMNDVLAKVLTGLGYRVLPFGSGGASLVTGLRPASR
jgi:hypothetical protein